MTWDPWREVEQRNHIAFFRRPLPSCASGFYARWPDGSAVVVVDDGQGRAEQTVALAHELVHDERGGGCPCSDSAPRSWDAVVRQEEHRVADIAACRLVPLDELEALVRRANSLDLPVTTAEVVECFDTTAEVAERALATLWRELRRRVDGR